MPQVPTYNPSVSPQGFSDGTINSDVNVGQSLGPGLNAVASSVLRVAKIEQEKADKIALQSAETQLSKWTNDRLFNPEKGLFNRRGKDAIGLSPEALPEFDKAVGHITSALNDRQRQAFQATQDTTRLNFQETLDRHESQEREAYYNAESQAAVEDAIASAGNFYNDPRQIRYQIARSERAIGEQARRNGWSPEQTEAALRLAESKTHLEVLDRMIAIRQSGMARRYLNDVRDNMLGDDVTTAERALRTENEVTKSEYRQRLQDLKAAAQFGKAENAPSRAELVSNFGENEGNRLANEADQLIQLSADVNRLNDMSATELVNTIATYEPSQQEGAAARAEQSGFIDTAVRNILTAREKDPAAYLIGEDPIVGKAWMDMMQQEEGAADRYMAAVSAKKDQLEIVNDDFLPKGYADQLVANIVTPRDSETLYATMNTEAERWGQWWPQVHAQLAPKLPDTAAIIGSGIPPQAGIALSAMANLKDVEIKALVPIDKEYSDVVIDVREQFYDMLQTFPPTTGGTRTAQALLDSGVRLALYYTNNGSDYKSAVQLAYKNLVTDQYTLTHFRGVHYRVPGGIEVEQVETGADYLIDTFEYPEVSGTPSSLTVEELTGLAQEEIQDRAYWVTNENGTGLIMYLDGAPVTTTMNPNDRVEYSWLELITAGQKATAEAELKRAEDQRVKAYKLK